MAQRTRKSSKSFKPSRGHRETGDQAAKADHDGDRGSAVGAVGSDSSVLDRPWVWALAALALVAGFLFRSLYLDLKPPHFDEGINGNFVAGMWRDGFYRYDPNNFHGPLYFFVLHLSELLFGRSLVVYRFMNGLISLANIFLVFRLGRYVGRAALWAGCVLAVSAGAVFYSRYAIHETLFIFWQLVFVYGYFWWREGQSRAAFAMLAAGVFGAMSVKETFFIFPLTWLIAVGVEWLTNRPPLARFLGQKGGPRDVVPGRLPFKRRDSLFLAPADSSDKIFIVFVAFFINVLLFTGFFMRPQGFGDMFSALAIWTKTGVGKSGHEKPFTYWLMLLQRYEWPAMAGLVLTVPVFIWGSRPLRIVSLTAFGTWLAYSIIPYKTPWLILNMLWPLALVFGGAIEMLAGLPDLAALSARVLALACVAGTFSTSLRLNFQDYASQNEPYVYVQTTKEMKGILDLVEKRVSLHPEDFNMKLMVLVKDPWPLPWVFGLYPQLNYGRPESVELSDTGFALVDGVDREVFERRVTGKFWRLPVLLRDSYERGFAYFEYEKFKDIVPAGSDLIPEVGIELQAPPLENGKIERKSKKGRQ